MEGSHSEQMPVADFLAERLKISLSIDPEAVQFLPEVTSEELRTKKEKYRLLLGEFTTERGTASVHIKAILEMSGEDRAYPKEEAGEISEINLPIIKQLVTNLQRANPEYAEYALLGEMHTHPVLPSELREGGEPWQASDGDITSIIEAYESGALAKERPFIFGIAGPDDSGDTQYAFYRLVKRENGYAVQTLSL